MEDFTYTQAKELIKAIGHFEVESYEHYGLTVISTSGTEYAIGTDEECDDAWGENLEDYIDECILPELNERYHLYFNREKWKSDARYDGRGHALSGYDGYENEVDGLYYYRIN